MSRLAVAALLACGVPFAALRAQAVQIGAQGIIVATRVDPVPGGGSLTEFRVVQPVLVLRVRTLDYHLAFQATANLEGWTMPAGELSPGGWGEGFSDRRHPHTFAHELMLSVVDPAGARTGAVHTSLSVGKGFAPFGTDDPMHRPTLRYPVNHHWSQVLERAVAILGVRAGPVAAEAGIFNGDEPERPGQWPRIAGRFGDSWAVRAHVTPVRGVTLQGSRAKVRSPEHRPGAGSSQYKWNASVEVARQLGEGRLSLLAEWARNSELDGFFVFHSLLLDGEWRYGDNRPYLRLERTERPEEMRTLDPFRSVRPHLENSILGTTRFTLLTAGYGWRLGQGGGLEPFAEVTYGTARSVGGGVFDPKTFYGRNDLWSASVGLRMRTGRALHLMGRYGVLAQDDSRASMDHRH
ncbi:MAG: hypothetical protein Q7J79_08355 [Gemmatimonadales bacterium]|nr:hypothetical protein [Gemmatimonadales bacterium]